MTIRETLDQTDLDREGVGIAVIGETFGSFERADDEDYFVFAADPGRRYSISVDSAFDTELGLFVTPTVALLGADDDGGPGLSPEILLETQTRSQLFLIEVDISESAEPGDPEAGAPGPLGSYRLDIVDQGPNEGVEPVEDAVGGTLEGAGGVSIANPASSSVDAAQDFDLFVLWLEKDRQYVVRAEGAEREGGAGPVNPFLEFFGPAGGEPILVNDDIDPLAEDPIAAEAAEVLYTAEESGFHFARVSASDLEQTGDYDLILADGGPDLPEDAEDSVGGTPETAEPLEAGLLTAGALETEGDTDAYRIWLGAGTEYAIGAQPVDNFDAVLGLIAPDGSRVLTQDDAEGGAPEIASFVPETSGFHTLTVSGFAGSDGAYEVAAFLIDPGETFQSEAEDIALLYEAGLGRQADAAGLNFWIGIYEGGASLLDIAGFFTTSPEFTATVGDIATISDEDLILALYENVLERDEDPRENDPEGFEFWVNAAGNPEVSDALLLQSFALAPENEAASRAALETLVFDPEATIEIGEETRMGVWDFDDALLA